MIVLRLALLGLALVVFASIGWRLATEAGPPPQRTVLVVPPVLPPPARVAAPAPVTPAAPPPAAVVSPAPAALPAPEAPPVSVANSPPALPDPAPPPPTAAPLAADAAMLDRLAAAPDLRGVFEAVRSAFPAVAERNLKALSAPGAALPTADDFVAGLMRDLRLSSGVLASRASPDALAAIFEAKATTLAELEAADPRICADYLFGGSSPEFTDFALGHRALVARSDLATIAAMADGRGRTTGYDAPSPEDYAAIEASLKAKGLSADEVAAVLDGKSLVPPPSDTRLCDNARAYLDAMRTLPADARDRVYGLAAELLARS